MSKKKKHFSSFPSQLLPAKLLKKKMKQSIAAEISARLKKTPFTLTNDGLYLLSIPLICL